MRVGQFFILTMFVVLAGNSLAIAQEGHDERSVLLQPTKHSILQGAEANLMPAKPTSAEPLKQDSQQMKTSRYYVGVDHYDSGPLNQFTTVTNSNSIDKPNRAPYLLEEWVPLKPKRASVNIRQNSSEGFTTVSEEAPYPEFETQNPGWNDQLPVTASNELAHQSYSPDFPSNQVNPLEKSYLHSTRVVESTQKCCDEWSNFCRPSRQKWDCRPSRLSWECDQRRLDWECNPRRLDWECDCEPFPRPERTLHGNSCGCGCRTNAIKARIQSRLQRLHCGCIEECTGSCQQDNAEECQEKYSAGQTTNEHRRDNAHVLHGPGKVGYGVFQVSQRIQQQ